MNRSELPSDAPGLRRAAAHAAAALSRGGWRAVLAFLGGVAVGWVVLGWWLFPVHWTNTTPPDLAPEWRTGYVRLVADVFVRDRDQAAAAAALAAFDDATLGSTLTELAGDADAETAQNARELAGALAVDVDAAIASDAAPDASPEGASVVRWTRALAWAVVLAGLAGAALLLRMRRRAARLQGGFDGPGSDPRATSTGARDAVVSPGPAPAPARASRAPVGAETTGSRAGIEPAGPRAGAEMAGRRSGETAAARQTERVRFGQAVRSRYEAGRSADWHAWLIHDERGELVGGAGWQAARIGAVNTVDFRLSDRDDFDQTTRTPIVRFVAEAAYADPILRARLSDRELAAAVPGATVALRTADLHVELRVEAVEVGAGDGATSLVALDLAFTPQRAGPTGGADLFEPEADVMWDDDADDADLEDAFEPEPRPPIRFRRE